jgi:hypothetical protein
MVAPFLCLTQTSKGAKMYYVIWEANGIHHECKAGNRLTARQVQEAIVDYWHGDGIRVTMWNGGVKDKEEVS